MSDGLQGRRVLITGAARGLGAEVATQLASHGARPALVGLEPEELAAVAARCGPETGWWEADVTDADSIGAAVEAAAAQLGGLDAAVINAGIAAGGPLRLADAGAYDRVIEVNLLGSVRTMRACIPHLVASHGYLLQIASVAAITAVPMLGAYCASKSGVEALARSVRGELLPHGVETGVAYLIWHDTEMVRGASRLPVLGEVRTKLPGPLSTSHPVFQGAARIVEGIERRKRTVAAPPWTKAMIPVRGLLGPMLERFGARDVPEIEQAITEHGVELTFPTGAGGAAGAGGREAPSGTGAAAER